MVANSDFNPVAGGLGECTPFRLCFEWKCQNNDFGAGSVCGFYDIVSQYTDRNWISRSDKGPSDDFGGDGYFLYASKEGSRSEEYGMIAQVDFNVLPPQQFFRLHTICSMQNVVLCMS